MTFQFSLKDFVVDETSVVMCAVGGMGVVINTAAAIFLSHKLKKHYSPFLRYDYLFSFLNYMKTFIDLFSRPLEILGYIHTLTLFTRNISFPLSRHLQGWQGSQKKRNCMKQV